MSSKLDSATHQLAVRRSALQRRYDDEDLHQLRVTLRRMRSFLKRRHGKRARHLRHQLGGLADVTGPARDWDTLLLRARAELGPRQFALLESILLARREAAHEPVEAMLDSTDWDQVTGAWDKYVRRHPPGAKDAQGHRRGLAGEKEAVHRARQRALAVDSVRNWHRLRIAVKALRYCLDEIPKAARTTDTRRLLRSCKRLQAYLGDWHDTVVHLQLVRELAPAFDPAVDTRAMKLVHQWCERIEKQGRDCLALARAELAVMPALA